MSEDLQWFAFFPQKYKAVVDLLTQEQCYNVLRAICRFPDDAENVELDEVANVVFTLIKSDFEKSRDKLNKRKEQNRINANLRWKDKAEDATECDCMRSHTTGCETSIIEKNIIENSDNIGNNINHINNMSFPDDFENIWSVYPRKEGKKKAFVVYSERLKEYKAEDLLRATKAYAEECRRKKTEEKFIKLPATFFGVNEPFTDYMNMELEEDKYKVIEGNPFEVEEKKKKRDDIYKVIEGNPFD